MPNFIDMIKGMLSATHAQQRAATRPQPVRTGTGGTVQSASGPVTSAYGAPAPIESRGMGDAVRVAMMRPQADPMGVPLDGVQVKPWAPGPDIAAQPLAEEPIVRPFVEPEIEGVPLADESLAGVSPFEQRLQAALMKGAAPLDSPLAASVPRVAGSPAGMPEWMADDMMPWRRFGVGR